MGYRTAFKGKFECSPPLNEYKVKYLRAFSKTRRMKRNAAIAFELKDELRDKIGLPVGLEGGYYVGSHKDGNSGQTRDRSIVEYNKPPMGQPELWCDWLPTHDGMFIKHNGSDSSYAYTEWLRYLIAHFLTPWGIVLNGSITYQGEEIGDLGTITINNNEVVLNPCGLQYVALNVDL